MSQKLQSVVSGILEMLFQAIISTSTTILKEQRGKLNLQKYSELRRLVPARLLWPLELVFDLNHSNLVWNIIIIQQCFRIN